jgi:hypothetical protein
MADSYQQIGVQEKGARRRRYLESGRGDFEIRPLPYGQLPGCIGADMRYGASGTVMRCIHEARRW